MKKLLAVSILLASCIVLIISSAMAAPPEAVQVFSEQAVDFGNYSRLGWSWDGDNGVVPARKTLSITSATFNYFPVGTTGTIGRADLAGRDAGNSAVWRQQVVYVEPRKTLHLTFPQPLLLKEGGYVEVGFVNDGPGTIFVSLQGYLE